MTAEHDQRLAEVETAAHRGVETELRAQLPHLIEGLTLAVSKNDDRKVRAYGNRLRLFAQFEELRGECIGPLVELGLRGFRENPSKADTWARFARERADDVQADLSRSSPETRLQPTSLGMHVGDHCSRKLSQPTGPAYRFLADRRLRNEPASLSAGVVSPDARKAWGQH